MKVTRKAAKLLSKPVINPAIRERTLSHSHVSPQRSPRSTNLHDGAPGNILYRVRTPTQGGRMDGSDTELSPRRLGFLSGMKPKVNADLLSLKYHTFKPSPKESTLY